MNTNEDISKSDISRLSRLAKYGKSVYATKMGIELDRGEFWGKIVDMTKLLRLGYVTSEKVKHGETVVNHYAVSSVGAEFLSKISE